MYVVGECDLVLPTEITIAHKYFISLRNSTSKNLSSRYTYTCEIEIANTCIQPSCPSIGDWLNKLWYSLQRMIMYIKKWRKTLCTTLEIVSRH